MKRGQNNYLRQWLGVFALLAGLAATLSGAPVPVPPPIQHNYDDARRHYELNRQDGQAAWRFAWACFDRAEFAKDDAERASLANQGIAACSEAMARDPKLAQAHYYLAMNLAQLARTKLLSALPLLTRMESAWEIAIRLDDKIDFGGPDRNIGLLYRDAPAWPLSIGDRRKARQHLLRAVQIRPDFPENYLTLIETYLDWADTFAARKAFERLRQQLPAAHKEFTGDYWDISWLDWNHRLVEIQARLNEPEPWRHRR
jgi:tetratricopeptide (TPR) repeat protein